MFVRRDTELAQGRDEETGLCLEPVGGLYPSLIVSRMRMVCVGSDVNVLEVFTMMVLQGIHTATVSMTM